MYCWLMNAVVHWMYEDIVESVFDNIHPSLLWHWRDPTYTKYCYSNLKKNFRFEYSEKNQKKSINSGSSSFWWRHMRRISINSFWCQTCQIVAVSGRHLHSSCSFCHIIWQLLAVARFLLQPQLFRTLCLCMTSHHLLLQSFTSGWRHSCFNSHFRT